MSLYSLISIVITLYQWTSLCNRWRPLHKTTINQRQGCVVHTPTSQWKLSKRRWKDCKGQRIREFAVSLCLQVKTEAFPKCLTNMYGLAKTQGLKPKSKHLNQRMLSIGERVYLMRSIHLLLAAQNQWSNLKTCIQESLYSLTRLCLCT